MGKIKDDYFSWEVHTTKYQEERLTFYIDFKYLLFNTSDICRIAGIQDEERKRLTDFDKKTIDLATALANVRQYDKNFTEWIYENFMGYVEVVDFHPDI